jgi:hypothetical protein
MRSATRRAWMRLPSGGRLDLANPNHLAWTDTDLAVRLSRTYRWGGESTWAVPLSVAQHSLTVLELRKQAATGQALTAQEARRELLHDADEAFLGFDCISPLKELLGDAFVTVSGRLLSAVWRRYSLAPWTPDDYAVHKHADLTAAACEAFYCVGWSLEEIRRDLEISSPVLPTDPLASIYDCRPWEPWPADVAAERFLTELVLIGEC